MTKVEKSNNSEKAVAMREKASCGEQEIWGSSMALGLGSGPRMRLSAPRALSLLCGGWCSVHETHER